MSEEEAQQLLYQMQMLEGYLTELSQKESSLLGVIREAISATETIKNSKIKSDSETLVPIGMGTYMKATLSPNQKVILNIGGGAAIEKDQDSAVNWIESRIKEMEIVLQQTNTQKQQVLTSLEGGKQKMNQLMQQSGQIKK
jgi:prefoldin alpha subunit